MKNPSVRTRLLPPVLTIMAVMGLSAGLHAVSPENTCSGFAAEYAAGMPVQEDMAGMSVTEKARSLSADFREATSAAEQSLACFDDALMAASSDAEVEAIGAEKIRTAALYSAVRAQFEVSLEAISNELLTGVAPAAGPGAVSDDSAFDGMEVLFDSYMLVERAHELTRRFATDTPSLQ